MLDEEDDDDETFSCCACCNPYLLIIAAAAFCRILVLPEIKKRIVMMKDWLNASLFYTLMSQGFV